ncbi:MAG: disulfide bond formation protein B [Alphaproteobacteria bacterium]
MAPHTIDASITRDPRAVPAAVAALALAVLGGAYAFQYLGGLEPCKLCLYQRWPWWIAGLAGLAGIALGHDRRLRRILILTAGLAMAVGAAIALFHVGVEQRWWQGPTSCSSGSALPDTLEAMMAAASRAPVVACNEVAWSLWGISMAGFNVLISAAGAAAALAYGLRYAGGSSRGTAEAAR